ncbi:hypothetical protein EDD17DRAFT_837279 [Pisolithus thermaeus]|nr:hypothetical protein EDD17DRAFT_837279 [Pisolithus thermaeus]
MRPRGGNGRTTFLLYHASFFLFFLLLFFLFLCHCNYRCPVWSPSCVATIFYWHHFVFGSRFAIDVVGRVP